MQKTLKLLILSAIVISMLNSCKKEVVNIEERITTFQLMVTDLTDPNLKIANFYWKDLDLEGPKSAIVDTMKLNAKHDYAVEIKLLNEANGSMTNLTDEIWQEKDAHLFIFKPLNADLTVSVTDKDSKKLPVGLTSIFKTNTISKGFLQVTLFHNSDKSNPYGSGTNELDVNFPVVIQ
jgi:hypothetical protein